METFLPPRAEILPDLWLDARRALWLAEARVLVVADLHWGFAASHRAQGNLLPLWGDEEIGDRLAALLADYAPAEMIWLGDSLHTLAGRASAETFLDRCPVPIAVLAGNHDRRWKRVGRAHARRGRFFFHHGDGTHPVPTGAVEVIGHHHPSLSWRDGAGGRLKLPALVASPTRLILPAFSPWAAGSPWNRRLQAGERLWGIAPRRIFPLTESRAALPALSA